MAVLAETMSTTMDLLSMVWMELAMFAMAAVGYILFSGGLPIFQVPEKAVKKIAEDSKGQSEDEKLEKELLTQLEEGNHQTVFKLWQRVKTLDRVPIVGLTEIVESMQKLGKPAAEIVGEVRSTMECNEAFTDTEMVARLLDSLAKDGSVELLGPLVETAEAQRVPVNVTVYETLIFKLFQKQNFKELAKLVKKFEKLGVTLTPRIRMTLISSALRQNRLDEALEHLSAMPKTKAAAIPPPVTSRLLSVAGKAQRLTEVVGKLQELQVKFDTKSLDEALSESLKRGDTVTCRQLYQLASALKIPKSARTFEMLLKTHSSDSATVRSLFEEIIAEGSEVTLTEALGLTLLGICATNKDAKLAAEVFEKTALSYGETPDHALYAALIKVYVNCDLYEKATAVYEEEMVTKQVKPDPALSDLLMKAAVNAGRGSLAQGLFEQSPGDVTKHVTMIKACGKEHNLEGAVSVFNKLKQGGVQMNSMIYNCLLDACVQCGDTAAAHEHFKQMKELAFVDVVSYNTMLKSYLHVGKVDEASQLLEEMVTQGLAANKVTYNELLNAKVQSKDRRGMWKLIEQMQAAGMTPSSVTCSILLKSLTRNSHSADVTRTMDLIEQMDEPMDEVLFSSVIEACIRIGQLDLLSKKMRKYASQGGLVALTAPTYGSMIKAYGQARDVERIWELWMEMRGREVKPTAITLGCMIDALVMNNCVEDAWDLVNKVYKDEEQRVSVNTVIYSTILKGFAISKQPEKLMQVYTEMREREVPCNTISYNTMLDACAKCGAMHRVPDLLEDMKAARPRVEPDVITYSTIVKGYCNSGDVDKALQVLQEMKRDGKHAPDEILYNSLLDGCAKQHRLEDALNLLDDMQDAGVVPSNFTLSILVKLLGRSRRLNQAFDMVETICKENGFRPNIYVYTCLMQACIQNRQLGKAITLHDQILNDGGCTPDQKTYSCLARGCMNSGAMEKAVEVIRCAFHLPGHSMVQTKGSPSGVETRLLEEVVMKLNAGSRGEIEVGQELLADLKKRNINVQDNVYSQVVRQAADNGFQQRGKGGGKGWSSKGKW